MTSIGSDRFRKGKMTSRKTPSLAGTTKKEKIKMWDQRLFCANDDTAFSGDTGISNHACVNIGMSQILL